MAENRLNFVEFLSRSKLVLALSFERILKIDLIWLFLDAFAKCFMLAYLPPNHLHLDEMPRGILLKIFVPFHNFVFVFVLFHKLES